MTRGPRYHRNDEPLGPPTARYRRGSLRCGVHSVGEMTIGRVSRRQTSSATFTPHSLNLTFQRMPSEPCCVDAELPTNSCKWPIVEFDQNDDPLVGEPLIGVRSHAPVSTNAAHDAMSAGSASLWARASATDGEYDCASLA